MFSWASIPRRKEVYDTALLPRRVAVERLESFFGISEAVFGLPACAGESVIA